MSNDISLASQLFPTTTPRLDWLMSYAERIAIIQILRTSHPTLALEIGTARGGCLQQITEHACHTFSIDIDASVRANLEPLLSNVSFLTGQSSELIPQVLEECRQRGQSLGFVLVDGDHRYEGVKADLDALLAYRPTAPLWLLMHDSSNPECRRGIRDANWAANPHVHAVELDFVSGSISNQPQFDGQIWGGLALALLLPEPRSGNLVIGESLAHHHKVLYRSSIHFPSVGNTTKFWLRTKWKGLKRRLGKN